MLDPMIAALVACIAALAAVPPDPDAARAAAQQSAERDLVAQLVPAPLDADARRAMAAALGLGATEAEAVALLDARYQAAIEGRHLDAGRAVRARIASSHRMAPANGALEPQPGPELVAVLRESAAWRAALASADAELLQGLANQRRALGPEGPSMILVRRATERDGMPASDPLADVRLPELIDVAGLEPAPRQAIEEAMEPALAKVAAAIAARRRAVDAAEVERAALLESWGPSWRLTADLPLAAEREAALERFDARTRAAEAPLAAANREAIATMLRMLPSAAADRVRDRVDRLLWPWLGEPERSLDAAAREAAAASPAAVAEAIEGARTDLRTRLEPTRREAARRAERVDQAVEAIGDGPAPHEPAAVLALLEAQSSLEDILARRRRTMREAAERMRRAAAGEARATELIEERIAALEAAARTASWRQAGFLARRDELRAAGPAAADDGAAPPAPPAP
jgi:hypothetical protein